MIRTVLVANRGEIARRVFRTCREMGIRTVAVYSDADVHAPHVADADEAIHIGAAEPSQSYLDIGKILAAARSTEADAIHPGYGFLSENSAFARACSDAGITFIGPSPDAIETMGSKLASKRLMDESGVPTLPSVEVTAELDVEAAASDIGYPVLVKASAGGGGKGMRIVESADDLGASVEGAAREAESAFGDGTVFLEKYLVGPRHIEVQVFGDTRGTVVSLNERECSVQRRHQKVIEEAPSPIVDADLRTRLGEAAVAAAKAVSYVGAGTVEFLVDGDGFYFLEMNTRLQVEHPVTELITGLDLVRAQIEVADGDPLRFGEIEPRGHAIEARVYAEDPSNDFLPATGTVSTFEVDAGVRVDSGVESGSDVSIYYDPMLAKVIAHGETRADAVRRLSRALRTSRIHGVTTNVTLLVNVLEHDDFAGDGVDTGWLERQDPATIAGARTDMATLEAMALSASIAGQARRRSQALVLRTLPSGWRNNPSQLTEDAYRLGDRRIVVGYRIAANRLTYEIDGDGRPEAVIRSATPDEVRLLVGDRDVTFDVCTLDSFIYIGNADFSIRLEREARLPVPDLGIDPGSLLSPMPGKVVRTEVARGDVVTAGTTLVVVEAMKMEHAIAAPIDGTVTSLPVEAGDQVEADQVLAVVEPT